MGFSRVIWGNHVEPTIGICENCSDERQPLKLFLKQWLCPRCVKFKKRVEVGKQQKQVTDREDEFMRWIIDGSRS